MRSMVASGNWLITFKPAAGRDTRRLSDCSALRNSSFTCGREQNAPWQRLIGSGAAFRLPVRCNSFRPKSRLGLRGSSWMPLGVSVSMSS
ncbi:hypothetical protein D3C85_1069190 [compost metagenome]